MTPAIVGLLFFSFVISTEANSVDKVCEIDDGCVYPEYNEEESLTYLLYSKIAFCSGRAITAWECGYMCEKVNAYKIRYIPEGPERRVQGYVAHIPPSTPEVPPEETDDTETAPDSVVATKCVVAFRGSLKLKNWKADFTVGLREWPQGEVVEWCQGCKAHIGFTSAYDELREEIYSAISDLGCESLVVAGHSLGAAVAMVASFDLRSAKNYSVEATWAYGKPRVGNREFVDGFEAAAKSQGVSPSVWRVVHYHDIVPRIPPSLPLLRYEHGGLEVYYTDRTNTDYLVCPPDGKAENKSKACMGGFPYWRCINQDHVETYLNETFRYKFFPKDCTREE